MLKFKNSSFNLGLTDGFDYSGLSGREKDQLGILDSDEASFTDRLYGGSSSSLHRRNDSVIRTFSAMPSSFAEIPDPSPVKPSEKEEKPEKSNENKTAVEKPIKDTESDASEKATDTVHSEKKEEKPIENSGTDILEKENDKEENIGAKDEEAVDGEDHYDFLNDSDYNDSVEDTTKKSDNAYNDSDAADISDEAAKKQRKNNGTEIATIEADKPSEEESASTDSGISAEDAIEGNEIIDKRELSLDKNEIMEEEPSEEPIKEKFSHGKPTGPIFPWQAQFAVADAYAGAYMDIVDKKGILDVSESLFQESGVNPKTGEFVPLGEKGGSITGYGCVLTSYTRIGNALNTSNNDYDLLYTNELAKKNELYIGENKNLLDNWKGGPKLIETISEGKFGVKLKTSLSNLDINSYGKQLEDIKNSKEKLYAITIRLSTGHTVNLNPDGIIKNDLSEYSLKVNNTSDGKYLPKGVKNCVITNEKDIKRIDIFEITPK